MTDRADRPVWLLMKMLKPGATGWLAALMMLSALTEGFGVLLMIPMLELLGSGSASGGPGRWLLAAGVPRRLDVLLAIFAGLVVLRSVVNLARDLASLQLQVSVVDGLRNRVFSALLHCDWRAVSAMRQSDNASLLISNVDRVGNAVHYFLILLATVTTLAGVSGAALLISPWVALGGLAGGAISLAAYRTLSRRAARLGGQLGEAYRRVHGQVGESLGALRVIKSYGREDRAQSDLAGNFRALRSAERGFLRDSGLAKIVLESSAAILVALLVWVAVERWGQGPADILPLVVLFGRCLPLLSVAQGTWQNWAHDRPALDEVAALLFETEAAREPDGGGQEAPRLCHAIALERVTVRFSGRGRAALDAIDLEIPASGMTALVGPSGSGKSTLADLAGGLIAPDEGVVRIDGVALGTGLKRQWRRSVAYVQQEPVLFAGTVRENLAWAEPQASDTQMREALARASADFVEHLPAGLDTVVGEGGRQLSGGERQRIVLARALLRRPSLLILDEATSALDAGNEAAIARVLDRLRAEMAVLVICHRGELQKLADRVVRLDSGRIVALEDRARIRE